jgi:hypothetical protein
LAISWERIASAREEQGERAAALDAWRRALAISLPMAIVYRDSVDLVTTPVVHLAGAARNLAGDDGAARAELAVSMAELLPLLRSLTQAGRLDSRRATWADLLERKLEKLRRERVRP